jgi:hypothetical protein
LRHHRQDTEDANYGSGERHEYSTLLIDATGPGSHTTNAGTDRRRAVQIVVRVRVLCEGYESRARTEIGHPN